MIPEWNSFINADCMEYLEQFPDDYFDLAIVDPPYGGAIKIMMPLHSVMVADLVSILM